MWPLQATALWLLWRSSAVLTVDRASALGAWLVGRLGPRSSFARAPFANLRTAFPAAPIPEITRMMGGVWRNVGGVLAEYAFLDRFAGDDWRGRLEIVGAEHVAPFREAGRPCIFVSAHLGNWELAALAIVRLGVPLAVVYKPLKNPAVDRMLRRQRAALGCDLVPKGLSGTRQLVELLRRGRSLGLLVDGRRMDGAPVPFFGLDAMTTTAPARLALRFGCPIIPVRIERLDDGARFRATFYPPLAAASAGIPEASRVLHLTRLINATFEGWIRERPEQWYCSVRRWRLGAAAQSAGRPPDGEPATTPPPEAARPA